MRYYLVALYILIALFAYLIEPLFGIRFALSPSLPYRIFISSPSKQIVNGHYISFHHFNSSVPIAKQVIGVAGDRIAICDHQFYINDRQFGVLQNRSKSGGPLHPIINGIIPEGYLFVYGSHPDSFDSRYREFGLISVTQVKEALWPLF